MILCKKTINHIDTTGKLSSDAIAKCAFCGGIVGSFFGGLTASSACGFVTLGGALVPCGAASAAAGLPVGVVAGLNVCSVINIIMGPPKDSCPPGGKNGGDDEIDECYEQCKHLLPSPSGDLQSSEFRKCYRQCVGSFFPD